MVCHHGAGTSALSFACFAKEVSDMSKGECGVLALDARRHGASIFISAELGHRALNCILGKTKSTSEKPDSDLSISVLTSDLFALLQTLYPDPSTTPTFIVRVFFYKNCKSLLRYDAAGRAQYGRLSCSSRLSTLTGTKVQSRRCGSIRRCRRYISLDMTCLISLTWFI